VKVSYSYGFSSDVGGGPYPRRSTLADPSNYAWIKTVAQIGADYTDLSVAVSDFNSWAANPGDDIQPKGIITILDNGTYTGDLTINLPDNADLVIQAADGMRPFLHLNITVNCNEGEAAFTVNGLLIAGWLDVNGHVNLEIKHCTLVPGRELTVDGQPAQPGEASLTVEADSGSPLITITHSIVGSLRLPVGCEHLTIEDSIVQAFHLDGQPLIRAAIAADDTDDGYGPPTTIERSTIYGRVLVRELTLASEVIFNDKVTAERCQVGCVRFSYVPDESKTPRRYRCQPAMALKGVTDEDEEDRIKTRMKPTYTSTIYSRPEYAQLSLTCAVEIRTGAEDGSEMGVFCHLKQPQREANLRVVLEEYLRFGLEAGIFYVN
jgi:hypothetical protein